VLRVLRKASGSRKTARAARSVELAPALLLLVVRGRPGSAAAGERARVRGEGERVRSLGSRHLERPSWSTHSTFARSEGMNRSP